MRSLSFTRLNLALRAFATVLLFAAAPVFAQNYTTNITLAKLLAAGGPVPYAQVCAYPSDIYGNPISVSAPTWGLLLAGTPAGCGTVVNGAFASPLPVPDSAHTDASGPIYYNLSIQQTSSSGTPTAQAIFFKAVANITGTAWALDSYAPSANVPVPPSNVLTVSPSAPGSCTTPSIYMPSSPGTSPEYCQNGVYVSFPSSGSGSGGSLAAYSGTTGYTAGQVVLYNDIGYIATVNTTGNLPTATAYWTPLWAAATEPIGTAAQTAANAAATAAAAAQTTANTGVANAATAENAVTNLATPTGIATALGFTPAPGASISALGLNALWDFTQTASNIVPDLSGSSNPISCGSAGTSGFASPTAVLSTGLQFLSTTNAGCDLPASLNGDRTFAFMWTAQPLPVSTYNGTVNQARNSSQTLLGPSIVNGVQIEAGTQNADYFNNPGIFTANIASYTFAITSRSVGTHVLTFTLGTNASTDPNRLYLDGNLLSATNNVGAAAGIQTGIGGNLELCGNVRVGNNCTGVFTFGAAAAGELTQAQIQQLTLYLQGLAPSKGINLSPTPISSPVAQVSVTADSIGACYEAATGTSCPAYAGLALKFPAVQIDWGIGGITSASLLANYPIREGTYGPAQTGTNVNIWEAGTNSMLSSIGTCTTNLATTAQAILNDAIAHAILVKASGGLPIIETVLTGAGVSPCAQSGLSTFTATTTSGSATLTAVSSTAGLAVGNILSGTGIVANTEIAPGGVGTSTLTMNVAATASGTVTVTPSGYSKDQMRDAYNTLVREVWPRYFAAIADTAAQPIMGADGNWANITYFNNDGGSPTHPQTAGQAFKFPSYQTAINRAVLGSKSDSCDPVTVVAAASPYADQDIDGCKVVDTASGNVLVNLMSALYQTGQVKRYCRTDSSTSSNTLTINAPSDLPFNNISGSTSLSIPNGKCQDVQSTIVSAQLGGDYWRTLN